MTRPTTTGKAQDLITFTRSTTGTYLGSDGLLKSSAIDEARIEYDASGNCLGLLVEEARTNLLQYSEDFANFYWNKNTITVSANNAIAPDGSASADKIVPNASNDRNHVIYKDVTNSPLDAFSLFVKPAGFNYVSLILQTSAGASSMGVQFNLLTGTVVTSQNANGIIQDVGNGWYRVTVTPTTSTTFYYAVIQPNDGSAPDTSDFFRSTFAGNGSDGVYLWGAQFERGAFPTSYIPTSGSAVARSSDVASLAVSEFGYNQDQGSVVVEASVNTLAQTNHNDLSLYGNGNTRIDSGYRVGGSSSGVYTLWVRNNNVDSALLLLSGITANTPYKTAYSLSNNDFALSLNGGSVAADTSGPVPTINQVKIGFGYDYLNGHIKSVQYYPLRLSNAQLQALTV